PTPTPTPIPPEAYTVRSGDTLLSIAIDYNVTVAEIQSFNDLDSDIIREGQTLYIPPPTPTPGPPPTVEPGQPTPTLSPFLTHIVRSGEVLSMIAQQYDVSIQDIRNANNIPAGSDIIQEGQVLQIPQFTPTPTLPPPEIVSLRTPTPRPAYLAPTLLYPPHEKNFVGDEALIVLQWASVGILDANEYYRLELQLPTADADPHIITVYLQATAWRVPTEHFPAPEIANRRCEWQVTVVRRIEQEGEPRYNTIGATSNTRAFYWVPLAP
ncbi:MAG TPA: LysM peptidoglycan-binding domain-containing protein, partial [Chloroflexi bacterium]|nr:LysM peptidoglycan-binding domain-containing protein [Chloroflexota bacterium]